MTSVAISIKKYGDIGRATIFETVGIDESLSFSESIIYTPAANKIFVIYSMHLHLVNATRATSVKFLSGPTVPATEIGIWAIEEKERIDITTESGLPVMRGLALGDSFTVSVSGAGLGDPHIKGWFQIGEVPN